MRLSELRPELAELSPDRWSLTFDCFRCGHPYRISVAFHRAAEAEGVWRCVAGWEPGEGPSIEKLSLVRSIRNHSHGYKHPTCGLHVTIVDGSMHVDD